MTLEATVDTGATHTTLPDSLLRRLNVEPLRDEIIELADGTTQIWSTGQARLSYDGEQWICPVNFGSENVYLLGATTLEIFDLMVDPVDQRFVRRPRRLIQHL